MKKKTLFKILFFIVFLCAFFAALIRFEPVETKLLQGFIKADNIKNEQLLKLSDISSSLVNVIFKSESFEENSDLKQKFKEKFNFKNIAFKDEDFSKLSEIYKHSPENFLSSNMRRLLEKKDYAAVEQESLKMLYNPLGIYIQTPEKDPYLLATDFVMSLNNGAFSNRDGVEFEGKVYSLLQLDIKKSDEIKDLIKLQQSINRENSGRIYLAGVPVHSALTSEKSAMEINLICLISSLLLILLCKFYFRTYRILLPVISSITFGMFFGYLVTTAFVGSVHILTFVFSTTLIGISLDYSLHYFLDGKGEGFLKNLTSAMVTTVLTFLLLLFSGVEILKQIAIFTSSGLIGVYSFVVLFFPLLKECKRENSISIPDLTKYKKFILACVIIVIICGFCKISFNNDIKNLYNPSKELLRAETIYKKVFNIPETDFVTVRGEDLNSIIKKEEEITQKLDAKKIVYYSLSRFFPSEETQKTNISLVKDLYFNNLDKFALFLDKKQRENLKKQIISKEPFYPDLEFTKKFMIDEKTSFIAVFNAKDIQIPKIEGVQKINVTQSITDELKYFRKLCMKVLPLMFVVLFGLLVWIFGLKKGIKIITPPLLGTVFAVSVLSLFNQPLNMFNILAMFLIVGFSLDYSIFRAGGGKNSKDAVLISFISSAISFLLLSFTSFKLISSLGLVLFLGITSSYILSLVLISEREETDAM